MDTRKHASPPGEVLVRWALGAWFVASTLVAAQLLGPHLLPFQQSPDARRATALAALRPEDAARDEWLAVHVLSSDCGCSRRVADRLASDRRPEGYREVVVWIGAEGPVTSTLRARGVHVLAMTPEELASRLAVDAAPMLFSLSPDGRVHYEGGYTARKQGADLRDVAILRGAREGAPPPPLPVFGCAVSERLRSMTRLAPGVAP